MIFICKCYDFYMSRLVKFAEGEFYHIYNRGTDKRNIFMDKEDLMRFLLYLKVLNNIDPITSIYLHELKEKKIKVIGPTYDQQLVEIICFCLNPNHYHFLLKQVSDNGISKFMHRLGTAYVMYFNQKYKRSGTLFQGKFKAIHVESNEYLLYLSAYINLNFEIHGKWEGVDNSMTYSSWLEYCGDSKDKLCHKDIILDQFYSRLEYQDFAFKTSAEIKKRRREDKVLDAYLLE